MDTSNLKFFNQYQPQTLQIAVWLSYFNAFFALLYFNPIVLVGSALGAFGIANEKKWGYYLALVMACLPLLFRIWLGGLFAATGLLNLMFEIALVVALLHNQSRDYIKIWFK